MKSKLLLSFTGLSDADLVALGASIVEQMTGNLNFPDFTTQIDNMTTSYQAFASAIPSRNVRNSVNTAIKNEKRAAFIVEAVSLGHLVMAVAKGDRAIQESSGYPVNQPSQKKPAPSRPINVEAFVTPQPNTFLVSCHSNKDADLYKARVWEEGGDVEKAWQNASSTSKVLVTGISNGVNVFVQMMCENSNGESNWSEPILTRLPLPMEPKVKYLAS